jgi:hypothetical protein
VDVPSIWSILQPGGPPPVPTALTATPGNAQVALAWGASSGATSYNVKRSTVNGSGYATVASPTVTNYTNTGLTNGTTYYYVVSAVSAGGESANSAQASATPIAPPAAPTGLVATAGNSQVALSWAASSGATGYNVKRSTVNGSGYATVASPATTSYTNTGLTNGTTYYYVVTAINAGGESGNSSQASATPNTGNTHGGSWGLKGVPTGTPAWKNTWQTVSGVAANQTYTASFWLKGSGGVLLILYNGAWGTEIKRVTYTATSTWTQCSTTIPTGSNTQLTVALSDGTSTGGTLYIDDCFLGVLNGTNILGNPGFESGNTTWNVDVPSVWSILQNP